MSRVLERGGAGRRGANGTQARTDGLRDALRDRVASGVEIERRNAARWGEGILLIMERDNALNPEVFVRLRAEFAGVRGGKDLPDEEQESPDGELPAMSPEISQFSILR